MFLTSLGLDGLKAGGFEMVVVFGRSGMSHAKQRERSIKEGKELTHRLLMLRISCPILHVSSEKDK